MNILAIGAHPDDIEWGCGGAIAKAAANLSNETTMLVLTNGANNGHVEVRQSEQQQAANKLGAQLIMLGEPDGALKVTRQIIQTVETIIKQREIDSVMVHAPSDSHQDHRAANDIATAAARHVPNVLFYQSPSTLDFCPTAYVDIDEHLAMKLAALECHDSQVRGSLLVEPDVVPATARYLGLQARLRNAEGFVPLRMAVAL
jgi:LmbE family N-acetylglucosaminyl deacetylase